MSKSVYQISKRFDKNDEFALEVFRGQLIQMGIKEEGLSELYAKNHIIVSFYEKSRKRIQILQSKLLALGVSKRSLGIKKIEEEDWINVWKESFKPFQLTKQIKVVPIWEKNKYCLNSNRVIYIDTKLAFGTGLHETTRFTARLIERCAGKFKSFFDIGTGTGILAMVALKNGAQEAAGIDIDPTAIVIAKENLKNNDCAQCEVRALDLRSVRSKRKYDFVAANLITHDLIRLKEKILSFVKKDYYLAISGVSLDNLKRVKDSFKELPLRCVKIERGKKWTALLYKKLG